MANTKKETNVKEVKEVKTEKTIFETLSEINVNEHVDKKVAGSKELTYLSWPWAVDQISRIDPDWSYKILEFDADGYPVEHGLPYQKILGGYQVQTEVTVNGQTKRMWLPIMDSHNAAMKDVAYKVTTKYGAYMVPAVDAMAINKTIMRCLVKNLGMFGLGLYIYAGEDLPNSEAEPVQIDEETGEVKETTPKKEESKEKPKAKVQSASGMALAHTIEEGPLNKDKEQFLKGMQLIKFKDGFDKYNKEQTMMILQKGTEVGSENDKKAFAEILKMVQEGTIAFDID